jgi:hypothetical protein
MCAIGFCAAFAMSGDPRSGLAVSEDSVLTVVQESSAQVGRTLPTNTVVATNVSHNLARNPWHTNRVAQVIALSLFLLRPSVVSLNPRPPRKGYILNSPHVFHLLLFLILNRSSGGIIPAEKLARPHLHVVLNQGM